METLEIHEFSTRIEGETRGFQVGEFGNSTLREIPLPVAQGIRDQLFQIAEGTESYEPAVLGRVVLGDQQSDWSAIAIVTRSLDDQGNSFPTYRYFLCEGADRLWMILDWMEQYQKIRGRLPVFNPRETRGPGQQEVHMVGKKLKVNLDRGWQDWLSESTAPLLVEPSQNVTPQMINRMAELKAHRHQAVSWADNVVALSRPESFIIIQTATEGAYQQLTEIKEDLVGEASRLPGTEEDVAALFSEIKALIGNAQVRKERVQALATALEEKQLTKTQWSDIFNRLGATKALMGNPHGNDARLLTVRAIALPETLPEFLNWLNTEEEKNQESHQQIASAKFQFQLRIHEYRRLEPFLAEGIRIVLEQLIQRECELPVENVAWLLTAKEGLWAKYRDDLYENIRGDLKIISSSFGQN
ncbi:MAG: hypothetical protein AB4352_09050 [Hormoscilla sp.]